MLSPLRWQLIPAILALALGAAVWLSSARAQETDPPPWSGSGEILAVPEGSVPTDMGEGSAVSMDGLRVEPGVPSEGLAEILYALEQEQEHTLSFGDPAGPGTDAMPVGPYPEEVPSALAMLDGPLSASGALLPPHPDLGDRLLAVAGDGEWMLYHAARHPAPSVGTSGSGTLLNNAAGLDALWTGSGALSVQMAWSDADLPAVPLADDALLQALDAPVQVPFAAALEGNAPPEWRREVWLYQSSSGAWVLLAGPESLGTDPVLALHDGQAFWSGPGDGSLWRFHPLTGAVESQSTSDGVATVGLVYMNPADEERLAQFDPVARRITFTSIPLVPPSVP